MTAVVAIGLTSPATQAGAPFAIGQVFVEGDIPAGQYAHVDALPNFAVKPLCYWNDGSLKMAVVMGRADFTANVRKQINIVKRSTAPSAGTLLTAASIAAAAPSASVTIAGIGTVNLSSLLASPVRTSVSTKEMVECCYKARIGSDPQLYAWFFVRYCITGQSHVRVAIGNADLTSMRALKTYGVTITIGGVVQFTAATYYHSAFAGYDAEGWVGGDPQITPQHDTGYLVRTGLVPNYQEWRDPLSGELTYLAGLANYVPGANLGYSVSMGGTGYQDHIGLLARWEAMFIVFKGHKAAYGAVIAGGRAIRSYAIAYPDPTTLEPIRIADYPSWDTYGDNQGGTYDLVSLQQNGSSTLTYEKAHCPSAGYLPWMLTAQPFFLMTSHHAAKAFFLMESVIAGSGLNRLPRGQNRSRGWGIRLVSQASALVPAGLPAQYTDSSAWLVNIAIMNNAKYAGLTAIQKLVGMEDQYFNRSDPSAPNGSPSLGVGMFEQQFNSQAWGHAVKMQPCADMTAVTTFAKHMLNSAVWIYGDTATTSYPKTHAANYTLFIPSATNSALISDLNLTNFGQVYTATFSDPPPAAQLTNPGGNTLTGTSGSTPGDPTGYWANGLPSLGCAVDLGVTGAAAAHARLIAAVNWSVMEGTEFAAIPNFAVAPVAYKQQPLLFTATDSGAVVTTPGPSSVFDTASLLGAGSSVFDTHRGLGIPLPEVATGGTGGTCSLRDMIEVGDNPLSEIRWAITRWPTLGTLVLDGVGGWNYTGAADSFDFEAFVDGASLGTRTVTISAAGTVSTITGVTISPTTATGAATFTKTVSGTGSFSSAGTFSKISGGGSIDPSTGAFTPPAATGSIQTIVVRATSTQDPTKWAEATITIAAGTSTGTSTVTSVVVSPSTANVAGGATQTFTHVVNGAFSPSQAVTRSAALGSINSSGVYTAPVATGSIQADTITVTSTQDTTKSGTATVTIAAAAPSLAARTVTLILGDTAGVCANLTGIKVAFYDEPSPDLTTVARYQSGVQTTNASGVLTFSFNSTLASGGIGCVSVLMADGRHYLQPQAVS